METLLAWIGIILIIVGIVLLIKAIRKKTPKKKGVLLIVIGFLCWIIIAIVDMVMMSPAPNTSSENTSFVSEESQEDVQQETPTADIIFTDSTVYDDNDVKVNVSDYSENKDGIPSFRLEVENNSNTDYSIECYYFAINDIMVSSGIYDDVTAGKKYATTVEFAEDEISMLDVSGWNHEVDKISMLLSLVSDDGTISEVIDLPIRNAEIDNSYLDGEMLYTDSGNGLEVSLIRLNDDSSGALVLIKNRTDDMFNFYFDQTSVNDTMGGLDDYCSQASGDVLWSSEYAILPNSSAICALIVNDETLENIDQITAIDFKITYHFSSIKESDFLYTTETTDTISVL